MKVNKRRAPLLAIKEVIEMELFSTEETCVVTVQKKEEENSLKKSYLEHPLVPDGKEEPEVQVHTQPRQQTKPKTEPPIKEETKHCPPNPGLVEKTEIEMEVFPPFRVSEIELGEIKSDDSSIKSLPIKASHLKWRRLTPQRGLVVKDVFCLPRGHYLTQPERKLIPRGKEQARLAAMGMAARITIDYSWSASQMQSRLAMLFQGRFVAKAGRRFSFTYLQCVQSSRVLFVPDTPAEGWTGEQVLRISRNGALYIHSHQEHPQAEYERSASEMHAVSRKEFRLEACTESRLEEDSQLGEQTQPPVGGPTEESTLDLATILRLFRQDNMDQEVKTHIQVRRTDLLQSALQAVRRPDFCFSTTPIISFSGEETDGHEGTLREFFRLTLLELQLSSVFEGLPGRLFLTYELKALEDRKYYEAGVLIGWSLAQGGPGPRCLHPALYQLMCSQNPSLDDFSLEDIVDAETQIRLQQVHSCTDVRQLPPSLCDWVSSCGIPGIYSARSDEIPAIYIHLVKHHIYHRVSSMISQFTEGLNSCGGLWDMVQSHWKVFKPVMTSSDQHHLTLEEFKQLFTICYSRPDSPQRAAEDAAARHWETVLSLVSDGQADFSLEDLLAFITGADHLPPLGFPRLISVRYYSQDLSKSGVRLPYASTCALELFLPRDVGGAADLLVLVSRAIHEALGFTYFNKE